MEWSSSVVMLTLLCRLITIVTDWLLRVTEEGGGGLWQQLYSLTFKQCACVLVFVRESETANGKRRNHCVNKWLKKRHEYCQTSVDVHHYLFDCKISLSLCVWCVCVCIYVHLDTWSLNRVFRMSVSVYFSVQGSLQRSFMSPQLENKHISRHTHATIFLSAGSGNGHMIIITVRLGRYNIQTS